MTQLHEGHRERLLKRFEAAGVASMHDYEIVELLLTFVIPRRDTKPIAKKLMARYGSVHALLGAPPGELVETEGIGRRAALFLGLVRAVSSYCLREKCAGRPALTRQGEVQDFLRFHLGQRRDEYVAALYLDSSNRCIDTEIVAEGTVNQCAIYPRAIVERALRCGAAALILAHNHPGGALSASKADWSITERIFQVGRLLDMPLLDHIIISGDSVISLRDFPRWPGK
jgi:DNA repair protein RadC